MTLLFNLREHDTIVGSHPGVVFTSPGTYVRATSTTGKGSAYIFIVVPRTWLDGKYLRFRWQPGMVYTYYVRVFDGAYDRSSMVDFPPGSAKITKGNGLLQTLASGNGGAYSTVDALVNVSGGNQDMCTVIFEFEDNQVAQGAYLIVDWFEINWFAGGSNNIFREDFSTSLTMEVTGGDNDYGYISSGSAGPSSGSKDVKASFFIMLPSDSIIFKCSFDVKGQEMKNLSSFFDVRWNKTINLHAHTRIIQFASCSMKASIFVFLMDYSQIKCVSVIRHCGSKMIKASFIVRQFSNKSFESSFVVRHSETRMLLAFLHPRRSHSFVIPCNFSVRLATIFVDKESEQKNGESIEGW